MSDQLEQLRARIGELSVRALRVGGEKLLNRVENNMGVAMRHSHRLSEGIFEENDRILREMKTSIDRAEIIVAEAMEAKGKRISGG